MDPKLAEMYGTNVLDDTDLEKLAAAELAEGLSDGGMIDLDNVDPEALEALAQEVLEDDGDADDDGTDGQEKLAEADYLGRVMAHSYVQELRDIEKTAAMKELGPAGNAGGKTPGAAGHARVAGRKIMSAIKNNPKKSAGGVVAALGAGGAAEFMRRKSKNKEKNAFALTEAGHKLDARRYGAISKGHHDLSKAEDSYAKDAPFKAQAMRPGGGALHRIASRHSDYAARKHEKGQNAYNPFGGLGGQSRHEKQEKRSSALETLMEQRAYEILIENGIDPDAIEDQEKQSAAEGDYDVLANVVEQGAWELLAANGFVAEE